MDDERTPLEPEVLPPEDERDTGSRKRGPTLRARTERAFGPVVAGLILDFVDLGTFGPMGVYLGPVMGAAVGWYLVHVLQVGKPWRYGLIAAAALYCMVPFTEFVPFATLFGALVRFSERPRE